MSSASRLCLIDVMLKTWVYT